MLNPVMRSLLLALAACAALVWPGWGRPPPAMQAVWPAPALAGPLSAVQRMDGGVIPMPPNTPAAHASSLVAMPADSAASLLAFWFAGTRESAPDVQIAFSWFDRQHQAWQPARFVVNRAQMGAELGLGLRRLGNPVGWRDARGRVHLFVVATGLGGWAAGRVLHLIQKSPFGIDSSALSAMEFEADRTLPLSWLWDTSHLVRSMPLALADGGMLLPLYFELGIKYPMAARFDRDGRFVALQRLSARGDLLQPTLLMLTPSHWLALLRDHGPQQRIAVSATESGGVQWNDQPDLALANPDASIAALGLAPQALALAYNPSTQGRQTLTLALSANGRDWHDALTLAQGGPDSEYSYPALAWADGSLWVSYTDMRQRIAWQRLQVQPAAASVMSPSANATTPRPAAGVSAMETATATSTATAIEALHLPTTLMMSIARHLTWALVLAALAWRLLRKTWRLPITVLLAAWALWPGALGASYWLGLAFQTPSLASAAVAIWLLSRRPALPSRQGFALTLSAALLGWLMLLDTLALLPLPLYPLGFAPLAGVPVVAIALLLALRPTTRNVGRAALWACLLFGLTRLPSGNLWDALLDPWLFLLANGLLVWWGVRKTRACGAETVHT